ncbi:hypothetical protein CUMW_034290 [Citrus unshiu]|nr:hypothetical protein CUMW_034290 [Citrus unshiu]
MAQYRTIHAPITLPWYTSLANNWRLQMPSQLFRILTSNSICLLLSGFPSKPLDGLLQCTQFSSCHHRNLCADLFILD